jgi:hypothetical protein
MNDRDFPDFHHNEDLDSKYHREPSKEEIKKNERVAKVLGGFWLIVIFLIIYTSC